MKKYLNKKRKQYIFLGRVGSLGDMFYIIQDILGSGWRGWGGVGGGSLTGEGGGYLDKFCHFGQIWDDLLHHFDRFSLKTLKKRHFGHKKKSRTTDLLRNPDFQ